MGSRIKAIAKKEIKQLSRDKRMLFVLFFFPVFLLAIFGYAVNFDVQHIRIGIYDKDMTKESRELIQAFTSSEYFDLYEVIEDDDRVNFVLDTKLVQVVLVIPNNFSDDLLGGKENVDVQFLIDGVDGNTATIIHNYVNAAAMNFNRDFQKKILARYGAEAYTPIDYRPRFWFNPNLESTRFFIPGLIAMILIVTAVISVSLSLVREKERGTMEQINVSSLNTLELLLGKSLPYIFISLIDTAFILIAGYILFGVEVKGSYTLLFFTSLIFIIASTNIGIFVSVISDTQQVAFTIATFISMLPSLILSGFIFPIESMPPIIQVITNITPAKFYLSAIRAIMLKGVELHAFWMQLIYLILFAAFFLVLAIIIRKRKERLA
ncbi:MAG: ABC transporter permease [Melioribacteraceae bacterium]|nr:ABC transporter permease [Melioribacteraceae bacterium]MCF8356712.1 ABC transporter permease [Melioribacteraceae bacterium]MCF8396096.1 ABC transporter permease [Melioribacteraceae bacterium]MCF8421082.1 ABC transporter permease [Melioribacteraceae bacterium]